MINYDISWLINLQPMIPGEVSTIIHRQVKHRGYEWQRGGRCLTIFSAANYMGRMGNLGAVAQL